MKTIRRILASAVAIAVGLSSVHAETTNDWWTVDFETGYTAEAKITVATTPSDGVWSSTGDDASIVTADTVGGNETLKGQIDTQGGTLVWTPSTDNAPASLTKVLIDTDVYMVGSEDAPAASAGEVQTEVYLKIVGETATLCAHVGDEVEGDKWVELTGVSVANETWIKLRIEIDYATSTPKVSFFVDSTQMTAESVASFDVMESGAAKKTVTDVTFKGTGYFDNFVGKRVAATAPTYETGTDTNSGTSGAGGSIEEGEGTVTATFTNTDTKYIKMTGPGGYVRTARVTTGVATFSTVGLPAGTYSITAYYGEAPTVIPALYVPAAAAAEGKKAAVVAGGNITLNVVPVSGLYYTLFAGETVAGAKAAATSTLASLGDEDAGFLQLTMPVPENSNEVKIIKIVASDESYALEADMPTNP